MKKPIRKNLCLYKADCAFMQVYSSLDMMGFSTDIWSYISVQKDKLYTKPGGGKLF